MLLDVGTGYYVDKPVEESKSFLNGKLDMLAKNVEKVSIALAGKRRDLEAVTMILQTKLSAQRSIDKSAGPSAAAPGAVSYAAAAAASQ